MSDPTTPRNRPDNEAILRNTPPARGKSDRLSPDREGFQPEELERLAQSTGLAVETLQNAGSFYADKAWRNRKDSVVQVCDGISCHLGGGEAIESVLHRYGHECDKVYCLGFCDRSPVSMIPFDQMREHTPVSIRNFAPRAILTRRILNGPIRKIQSAIESGVYSGLIYGLKFPPTHLINEVEKSGEGSRGETVGSTGKKWRTTAEIDSDKKYVIANGDEGEPGSFLDRVLMEKDPHTIIEGMILCGYATGASEGIVYIRSEYPRAIELMHTAITEARREGYLGKDICSSGFSFDIRVFIGKGSYASTEKTKLIASLDGNSNEFHPDAPFSERLGLQGKPTLVNNIETLSNIPFIALKGGDAYALYGTHATRGTKAICLNHGFQNPGLVEVEFGITFREVIEEIGGGGRDGEALAAVLIGGPMGTMLKPEDLDYPICYEVLNRHKIHLGHGGFVAIPESTDFNDLLVHFTKFMIRESCRQCRPGAEALLKAIEENREISELEKILGAIESDSLCKSSQLVPGPIRTLLTDFSDRLS